MAAMDSKWQATASKLFCPSRRREEVRQVSPRVMRLREEISWHLDEVEKQFRDPVKITIVVRNLVSSERDVVMGNDAPADAIAAIQRLADGTAILIPADKP
jgi:hypothetical protein